MSKNKGNSFMESKNSITELADKNYEDMQRKSNTTLRTAGNIIVVFAIVIAVVCFFFCAQYWSKAVTAGADAIVEAYSNTKDSRVEEICQEFWEKGYARGEKEYHTSNRISISINEVRETANLEVMKVSDVVYDIESEGTQSWLKATGTGVYTVNLAAGEYLIDDERQYVLVRVPRPELTTVNIDDAELMLIKENKIVFNGSVGEGEDLARAQRARAQIKLLEDIESNQTFYQNAEDSAKSLIKSLVKKFNPKIEKLEVDVEFFE